MLACRGENQEDQGNLSRRNKAVPTEYKQEQKPQVSSREARERDLSYKNGGAAAYS